MRLAGLLLALLLPSVWLFAQLPPSEKLTPEDDRGFRKELERLEALLLKSNNKPAVRLQIANTYAAGGQYAEAIRRLRNLAAANFGFEPSRDPDFAKLRGTAEFQSIMNQVQRQTPPVHNSRLLATLSGADVRPENIAFDTKRNAILLGDTREFKLIRCSLSGECVPFVTADPEEKSYVLGLKIDPRGETVWATDNRPGSAGLRCYDLETARLLRTVAVGGKHVFNDLAVSLSGAVYVTDTAEGSVYELPPGTTSLRRLAPLHNFTAANGIALSADGMLLYLSAWEDGIDVIDLGQGR